MVGNGAREKKCFWTGGRGGSHQSNGKKSLCLFTSDEGRNDTKQLGKKDESSKHRLST